MLWYIMCQNSKSSASLQKFDDRLLEDNFIDSFDLDGKSYDETTIALIYFAFTSLSTVGLGDYHPRSNLERFVGAFVLLFGVALTSYIMEALIGIILKIQNLNKNFEE